MVIVFLLAGGIMLLVFQYAGWRAQTALLPRYCADPGGTIRIVRKIISATEPAGDEKRRPYIIAAKLIFLIPQEAGETQEAYLSRLRLRIEESCAQAY